MSFEADLKWGEEGEALVTKWLTDRGFVVAPLYQFNAESAPVLFSKNQTLLSPDLSVFRDNRAFFAEIKRKKRWVKSRQNGMETGYDMKHHRHYMEVRRLTGLPVWAVFVHEDQQPTGLYTVEIGSARCRFWDGLHCKTKRRVSRPMVFYQFNNLHKLSGFGDCSA